MGKNIVICCDDTGNQYGDRNTNVVKLYSVLERDPLTQIAFYDPGVGTFSVHPVLTTVARMVMRGLGLAFGLGITRNMLDAYWYIMQNYEKDDQIFLFGFSRGAYTARAVAAMIHKCGLLYPDNENLLPYATQLFKREHRPEIYEGFKSTFSRPCSIHFLGLWDTVTSVGWVWDPLTLPFTTNNPSVSVVRHAISIDERRAFFRQNLWGRAGKAEDQDIKQVWFAGVHSDVGGSYPENESGLSKVALEWMIIEAVRHGLKMDRLTAKEVVSKPVPPDHEAPIHRSLRWYWWPAEFWPKLYHDPRDNYRRKFHLNLARRRRISDNAWVHESVLKRMNDVSDYSPTNLPERYRKEPWQRLQSILTSNSD